MLKDGKILIAKENNGNDVFLLPKMANRHGLIAGATGSGKTVSLKVLAESFSDMGVPVFLSDVKGDLQGMCKEGSGMEDRVEKLSLSKDNFSYSSYPVNFFDIYSQNGIPLRTTISEMGPLLLSRILGLNELQTDILTISFKIADDNNLLLVDSKDLKALLNYISENNKEFEAEYGKMSPVSISAILRSVVAMEMNGGDKFFGETALNINDLFEIRNGKGVINILDSRNLVQNGSLYSMFLLWLLSELFENLPEVGDMDKPKLVFFFDEAHLLFKDAPTVLLDKIEQVVKLIRSKGVGIYFVTQNPRDVPDAVLAQLGNKIQHALRAYTPAETKSVKAAAASFRENPEFDTYEAISNLGTGQAIVSMLDEDGIPQIAKLCDIVPPKSALGCISEAEYESLVKQSILYSKYEKYIDPDSAYEFLQRMGLEEAAKKDKEKEEEKAKKEQEKKDKEEAKAKAKEDASKKKAIKSVGTSVAGTVGREVGKNVGKNFGKFGKTLGGNVGASLGRGILNTLFKL